MGTRIVESVLIKLNPEMGTDCKQVRNNWAAVTTERTELQTGVCDSLLLWETNHKKLAEMPNFNESNSLITKGLMQILTPLINLGKSFPILSKIFLLTNRGELLSIISLGALY